MADPFYSSYRGILRAQHHIDDLNSNLVTFFKTKPYARVIDPHGDGLHQTHKLKLIRPMPEVFADIAADAVYNLRAALDRAAYAVTILEGKVRRPRNTYFPFGKTARNVRDCAKSGSQDIPVKIFKLMASFKPHKRGNRILWALNNACNSNKHRMLSAVALDVGGFHVKKMEVTSSTGRTRLIMSSWNRRKNEMIIGIFPAEGKINYNIRFTPAITFYKVEGLRNHEVITTLYDILDLVKAIVDATKAESISIGLLKSP